MEPQNNEDKVNSNNEETKEEKELPTDVAEARTFAILGYILPFLFFLPLINDSLKNVPYARFHANQQLILLIICLAAMFLHNILYMGLMGLGLLIIQVINLAILVLAIIGIINAYKGEMKELPFVGNFRILK